MTRDIAPKLGYFKPAQIHCKFLPGLGKGGKMSASLPETCIFTIDTPEVAERKIWNAFTGGKHTESEQKLHGGNPSICSIYQYFYYLFEESDKKIKELESRCKSGDIICGECKSLLADRVKKFLISHQKRREKAKDFIDQFFIN
jgi:tryptophanyl-tRNA synthetase